MDLEPPGPGEERLPGKKGSKPWEGLKVSEDSVTVKGVRPDHCCDVP